MGLFQYFSRAILMVCFNGVTSTHTPQHNQDGTHCHESVLHASEEYEMEQSDASDVFGDDVVDDEVDQDDDEDVDRFRPIDDESIQQSAWSFILMLLRPLMLVAVGALYVAWPTIQVRMASPPTTLVVGHVCNHAPCCSYPSGTVSSSTCTSACQHGRNVAAGARHPTGGGSG